jgi:hypothetical protein
MGKWFKALVTHDGVTQTLNSYASDELWFMDHDYRGQYNATGMKPGSPYYDWNPLLYVDEWTTPHFVVHNELDYRLPVSEGILLFNMLQIKGVPSKFLSFPDENHWVTKPENSLVWHTEIFDWINHYSGVKNSSETVAAATVESRDDLRVNFDSDHLNLGPPIASTVMHCALWSSSVAFTSKCGHVNTPRTQGGGLVMIGRD